MEDTLSLQLDRAGVRYASLAGDAVVGLASLSVTLVSRRRLAGNGTVESVGRLLAALLATSSPGPGVEGGGSGNTWGVRASLQEREALRNMVRGAGGGGGGRGSSLSFFRF